MSKKSTKERLLDAATQVFASQGYAGARVAEICDAADANVAAINYHFGSKEELMRAVIQQTFQIADAKFPIRGATDSQAPAEDRLRAFMSAMIRRSFDPGPAGQFDRIMSHHATRIGGPDDVIIDEVTRLQGNLLDAILGGLLGELPPRVAAQAKFNVIALCVFPNHVPKIRAFLFTATPPPDEVEKYIDRQLQFALTGLHTLCQQSSDS